MDMVLNIKPANLNVPAHIILTRNTISFCVSRHIPHQTLLSNLCGHWTAHITLLTCFYCNLLRHHDVKKSYATYPFLIISFEIAPSFLCALRTLQSNALWSFRAMPAQLWIVYPSMRLAAAFWNAKHTNWTPCSHFRPFSISCRIHAIRQLLPAEYTNTSSICTKDDVLGIKHHMYDVADFHLS